ncbi:MAG: macro domain-containing protein, partial [Comamonadaceae bacterium]
MNRKTIDPRLTLVVGRIVDQHDCDAVVDPTIGRLSAGGRLSGAVLMAAGSGLASYCAPLPPLQLGEVIVTPGFNLPMPWIIHLRVPLFHETADPGAALATVILSALTTAEAHRSRRIAFPALGVGQGLFPPTIA